MQVVRQVRPVHFSGRFHTNPSQNKETLSGGTSLVDPGVALIGASSSGYLSACPFAIIAEKGPEALPLSVLMTSGPVLTALNFQFMQKLAGQLAETTHTNKSKALSQDEQTQTNYEKEMLKLDGSIDAWQKKLEKAKQPLIQLKQEYNVIQQEINNAEADLAKMPTVLNELKLSTKKMR